MTAQEADLCECGTPTQVCECGEIRCYACDPASAYDDPECQAGAQ